MKSRWSGGLAVLAVTAVLAGCATPQTDALLAEPRSGPVRTAYIDAPFQAQRTDECGPAAMAMVLRWNGASAPIDQLVAEIYTPGRAGSLQSAMVAAARRHGYIPYPVRTLRGLISQLEAGQPVIVLQNLGLSWYPRWHYAVAIGYDLDAAEIILHSGETARLRQSLPLFERTWRRGDDWAVAIVAPARPPPGAGRDAWLTEAAGLERAGQVDAARRAFGAALALWPEDHRALMGLGNSLYALGKKADAAQAFRRAAATDPVSDAARNNLAHALTELGRLEDAEQAAREAVALNGPHIETARKTLAEILARKRTAP